VARGLIPCLRLFGSKLLLLKGGVVRGAVITGASIAGILTGCIIAYQFVEHTTKIAQLKRHPGEYKGKVVKVNGTVVGGMSVSGFGGYLLEDDTGKVLVKAPIVPAKGAKVTAQGRVEVPVQTPLGDIIVIDTTTQ
jgi:hypothetical protein